MAPRLELSEAERLELINLLYGALARHTCQRNAMAALWQSALVKIEGPRKLVLVERRP